jgi:hypothetical protein
MHSHYQMYLLLSNTSPLSNVSLTIKCVPIIRSIFHHQMHFHY